MPRYVHGKTTLAFSADQLVKLNHAAAIAANARLWTLVGLKNGVEPSDAPMLKKFEQETPFDFTAVPDFVWRQAIRNANREWRLWQQGKGAKPVAFTAQGSFPIRIWERDEGPSTPKSIKSEWLGEVFSHGGTPFGPGLHCVNVKRLPSGWVVSFSTKIETEAKGTFDIPDTFTPVDGATA